MRAILRPLASAQQWRPQVRVRAALLITGAFAVCRRLYTPAAGSNCVSSTFPPPPARSSLRPAPPLESTDTFTRDAHDDNSISSSGPTELDLAVERLSFEVFSKGNQHLKNVETLSSLPEGLHSFPEVAFIGKPSCGKSSLISCLLHNRRLAKTGQVRGTTRLLQFFNVGDALLLVDTPGYGGWRGRQVLYRPKDRAKAFAILFRYLALRKTGNLKRVYWCMEASATTPMALRPRDEEILFFLQREMIPFTVVLTKIDRHWHYYNDQSRTEETVDRRDGAPRSPPRQRERGGTTGRVAGVPLPEEGVRRNMAEICAFVGSVDVPIIGVSANRWHQEQSMNLTALQHDLVNHCSRDLMGGGGGSTDGVDGGIGGGRASALLTYRNLHTLSYAPPRAEDIERVQLTYPIESFVVPQDDRLSLQAMVDRHEGAKAHLLARGAELDFLSAKDAREGFLEDSRQLQGEADEEDGQRAALAGLPPTLHFAATTTTPPGISDGEHGGGEERTYQLVSSGEGDGGEGEGGGAAPRMAAGKSFFSSRASLRGGASQWSPEGFSPRTFEEEADEDEDEEEGEEWSQGETPHKRAAAFSSTYGAVVPVAPVPVPVAAVAPVEPSPPVPIPFSIDSDAQTVTAINGVRIPRSIVPATVEDLAIAAEDEISAFALRSGAGAYEEMLIYERHHPDSPQALAFMESSRIASLPEAELDRLLGQRPTHAKSASRRQKERMLAKYVGRERKDRAIYAQAEGYMCPWLGSSGRGTVVGLAATGTAQPTSRSGAVMRNLKQSGFGGKSVSARTMRGKGRATRKTGAWAA